ncbi:hypothetical protein [Falsirhodobacter algicola]|uniref:Uncharacterized protein n=1 Tax=Falsirhodobacter algicola TaxID=2692330 RepID=A0A8J8MT19_9RHOB|nr:hypothetical protein [Falsirhodobacter algicola]QUS35733.1 hypothetical protein GR316_05325 [Falsirhodobacter algicola]
MQDLVELERRIARALERIGTAAQSLQGDAAESRAVQEEREVNAQLAERLRVVKEKSSERIEALEAEVASLSEQLETLRAAAGELHEQLSQMRGDTTPAEIQSLQALRASDRAELDSILSALEPHVSKAEDAQHG